jgi:hypothetical protein
VGYYENNQKNIWISKLKVLIFAAALTSRCSKYMIEERVFSPPSRRKKVKKVLAG